MDLTNLRGKLSRLVAVELGSFSVKRSFLNVVSHGLPHFTLSYTRTALLRAGGVKIGRHSLVMGGVEFSGDGACSLLSIGESTVISGPIYVDLDAAISIGDSVWIGHRVQLMTVNHEIASSRRRCGQKVVAPIVIGDGCWIASRVTVLPGVTIGAGSVVAAGAVVTRDVAPNTLVGGVPARPIRELDSA